MPAVDLSQSMGSELEAAAERDAGRVLMHCDGRDLRVGELEARSLRVAGALQAWGVERGDRVAVMMGNVPEFVETWFAIARSGAIEVPVHVAYRGPLLEHVLRESGARVLFCDADLADRLAGLDLPELERVVVRGGVSALDLPQLSVCERAAALAGAPDPELPALAGEDPSCILYTSGTTGPSKGVVLSHSANLHLARSAIEFMRYGPDDVLYTAFPLFHVNAKYTSVTAALLSDARLVVDQKLSASRFWARMRETGVTAFNAMGSMLSILANQPPGPGDRDHCVNRCYEAGCPAALTRPFEERFGVTLYEHYGMTEIGIATLNLPTPGRAGSCGKPAPWFEVRLADERDREVTPGEVGEIQVRPREPGIVLQEYWRRPDATSAGFRNLWFHTGDRARQDADGYLYFVDRTKDSIRRRGENISSFEVENVVDAFPGVLESAAYGVPSELGEEEVMVAIVAEPGAALDIAALLEHCDANLARFSVPRYVRRLDALPKTPSERTQKFRLREAAITDDTFDRLSQRSVEGSPRGGEIDRP